MNTPLWIWIAFNGAVLTILALDLGVFHRKAHRIKMKEAGASTAVFVFLSMLFAALVWRTRGSEKGMEFLTGYLIEYSLSVDNIFVFVLLFKYFAVPAHLQHRVLFWGILAALLMRGAMIAMGAALLDRFEWIIYLFGAFLLITGYRMLTHPATEIHPDRNPLIRLCRRIFPVTEQFEGHRFFVVRDGRRMATPLFLVLVGVEVTDIIFAVDSIPAIFGVTRDPFIVYTSNICAILGLRSLYFLLAGVMSLFHYLQTGLALILVFIGGKMLLAHYVHIDTRLSLGVVIGILAASVALSLARNRREKREG